MRLVTRLGLASSILLWSIPQASALVWICNAPEIDGPAGLSVLAVLVSAGMVAYDRYRA